MRKLPDYLENPFDNIIINVCDRLLVLCRRLGISPNNITTLSLFLGIYSSYKLYLGDNVISFVFFLLAYVFDCLDGHYARSDNLVTKFGDYYDHFSDLIKIILILYVLFIKYKETFDKYLPFILLSIYFCLKHLGCQEKYYNKGESDTLGFLKNLCDCDNNKDLLKKINITRYLGNGTLILLLSLIILFVEK